MGENAILTKIADFDIEINNGNDLEGNISLKKDKELKINTKKY